jgi:tRNA (guanine37-N1)-methyltransferase
LRVPLSRAEEVRRELLALGRLAEGLKPIRTSDEVIFPLASDAGGPGGERPRDPEWFDFVEKAPLPAWRDLLSEEGREAAPSSFDIVGDVVILKIPPSAASQARSIAEALMAGRPRTRSVARDAGVHGPLRIRRLEVLAGDANTKTVHTESGMRLHVDPSRVYFSPRLAFERERVARLVEPGETVADLFAGVGPWSILIARRAKPRTVWAVDLNADAVHFLRQNIRENRVEGIVQAIAADARDFARDHPNEATRVIANLPRSAAAFWEDALAVAADRAVLHYYAILERDAIEPHARELVERASKTGIEARIEGRRVVRAYSSTSSHIGFDVRIRK